MCTIRALEYLGIEHRDELNSRYDFPDKTFVVRQEEVGASLSRTRQMNGVRRRGTERAANSRVVFCRFDGERHYFCNNTSQQRAKLICQFCTSLAVSSCKHLPKGEGAGDESILTLLHPRMNGINLLRVLRMILKLSGASFTLPRTAKRSANESRVLG